MADSKKRSYKTFSKEREADEDLLFGGGSGKKDATHDDDGELQDYGTRDLDPTYNNDDDGIVEDHDIPMDADDEGGNSDPDDGEDLDDNLEQDYRANAELDLYEQDGIDDDYQNKMTNDQRRQAEDDILRRNKVQNNGRQRGPAALHVDDDDSYDENALVQRGAQRLMAGATDEEQMHVDDVPMHEFENVKGELGEWIMKKDVMRYISATFTQFLRTYKDQNGNAVYEKRLQDMCNNNKCSFELVFTELTQKYPSLCLWLAEEPLKMLPILNQAAADLVTEIYPDYMNLHREIFVRVRDLPVEDKLRELRQVHLHALIKFKGVVTKRTGVFPQYVQVYLRCECGDLKGPIDTNDPQKAKHEVGKCYICQRYGPYTIDEIQTVYRNYQKLTIQESPGTVPPGRVPRQKEVYVLHDLVDTARPGDQVEVTGIFINRFDYFANITHGFPVFQTIVEANNLRREGDEDIIELTDEDKKEIIRASREDDIAQRIFNSVAPSIYGHNFIKKALTLAMFGGVAKDVEGKHRIRGDLNILLLGDPGTAKSQFLKYIEKVYHRVVYTTGKGASAVGLTAGVHRDPITGEWTLEGGALVLADKGLCLIDEFDKMNDQDRTSIHEAMEQQSISISKAGIVTSLQARCSVIAAANPIGGIYKPALNFNDNVDLTDPILSRFDILTVIRDEVIQAQDESLASFVINSHIKSHPEMQVDQFMEGTEERLAVEQLLGNTLLEENQVQESKKDMQLSQELFKKYIIYSKKYCNPKLSDIDKDKISTFYARIRQESSVTGGIAIAARHLESVVRMSEASAKIHLRNHVTRNDIDFAIDMMLESFLQTQKLSVSRQLSSKLQAFKLKENGDDTLLLHTLNKMAENQAILDKVNRGVEEVEKVPVSISVQAFKQQARDYQVTAVDKFLESNLFKKDFRLEDNKKTIKTVKQI